MFRSKRGKTTPHIGSSLCNRIQGKARHAQTELFPPFHLVINIHLFLSSITANIFTQYYLKVFLICKTYHSYNFTLYVDYD